MNTHSPGPWVIIKTESAHIGERAILDADYYTVCSPSPMGEANARLIAAAPNMLDALQAARRWVAMYENLPGHDAAARTMLNVIDRAIQEAT